MEAREANIKHENGKPRASDQKDTGATHKLNVVEVIFSNLPHTKLSSERFLEEPIGLVPTTRLFPYQKATLTRMYERETHPESYDDPLWTQETTNTPTDDVSASTDCYSSAHNGYTILYRNLLDQRRIVFNKPDQYTSCRGGLLCEDMGRGKTLICIALVLTTLGRRATPPREVGPIFPNLDFSGVFNCDNDHATVAMDIDHVDMLSAAASLDPTVNSRVPTLKSLCGAVVKANVAIDYQMAGILPNELLEYLHRQLPPPYYFREPPTPSESARIAMATPTNPVRVFLSAGTLVVVPANLLDQWEQELNKYILRESDTFGGVRRLVLRPGMAVPPPEQLAMFDIVVTALNRLRLAGSSALTHSPHKSSDVIDNKYNKEGVDTTGALSRVHWLRVIVDEGHVIGQHLSNQSRALAAIPAERRWAASGTMTPKTSPSAALNHFMGLLEFLHEQPFSEPAVYKKIIRRPLTSTTVSPQATQLAVRLLSAVLQRLVVRSAPDDVARQVELPPCHVGVTWLEFSPNERDRYNEFVGLIRTNLLCSRFEGVDSFYHPANRRYAAQALRNLHIACFYQRPLLADEYMVCSLACRHELSKPDVNPRHVGELKAISEIMEKGLRDLKITPNLPTNGEAQPATTTEAAADLIGTGQPGVDTANAPIASASTFDMSVFAYSTKLAYVMKRLQELTPHTKVIVFTQYNEVLRHLCDALDRLCDTPERIKFVEFHSKMGIKDRSSAVVTFNTSDDVRVIVMKTELAAFGINLTAASHIIFMDAVWDAAVERQAIGRADRIGQGKPVTIEILAMRNSVEAIIIGWKGTSMTLRSPTISSVNTPADSGLAWAGATVAAEQRRIHSLLKSVRFAGMEDVFQEEGPDVLEMRRNAPLTPRKRKRTDALSEVERLQRMRRIKRRKTAEASQQTHETSNVKS